MIRDEYQFDRLVARYDETVKPYTLTTWDDHGVEVVREYTPEETARADARIAHEADRAVIKQIVTDLLAEKERADEVINSVGATREDKQVARAVKRIADTAIDLARFVKAL